MPQAYMPHSCAGCRSPVAGGTTSSVVVLDSQSAIQSFTHPPPSQQNLTSSAKNHMSSQESTTSTSKSPVLPQQSSVSSEKWRISFGINSISSQTIKTNRCERNRDLIVWKEKDLIVWKEKDLIVWKETNIVCNKLDIVSNDQNKPFWKK